MKAAQANRARIAERASATRSTKPVRVRPVRNAKGAVGPIRNRRATKMTGIQRNSIGRMSEWSRAASEPRGGWR